MTTMRERIEAGAAWLDKRKPLWRSRIDRVTLDLEYGAHCVLGQTFEAEGRKAGMFNGYRAVIIGKRLGEQWAYEHGFVDDNDDEEGVLTQAWLAYLAEPMPEGTD